MIVTGTDTIQGREIADYLGVVSVRGSLYRHGVSGVPRIEHPTIHERLVEDLRVEAEDLGADAIVAFSISTFKETAIYSGTAVRLQEE